MPYKLTETETGQRCIWTVPDPSFDNSSVEISTAPIIDDDFLDSLVNDARIEFVNYLTSRGINVSNMGQSHSTLCNELYNSCLFIDATKCIDTEMKSWNYFIPYLPIACIAVIIAAIFNVVSMYFVKKNGNKMPRHFILQNVAISDLFLSLFTLFKRATDFIPYNIGSATTMPFKLVNNVWQVCWIVSALGVLLFSIDCFTAISFPYFYREKRCRLLTQVCVILTWAIGLTVTIVLAIMDMSYQIKVQNGMCWFMLAILIVIAADCVYTFIQAEKIRQEEKKLANVHVKHSLSRKYSMQQIFRNRLRSITTTTMITMSAILCWLPLLVYFLIPPDIHAENLDFSHRLLTVALILFHLNAVANPVIYSFRFSEVRRPMQKSFQNWIMLKPVGNLLRQSSTTMSFDSHISSISKQRRQSAFCNGGVIGNQSIRKLSSPAVLALTKFSDKNSVSSTNIDTPTIEQCAAIGTQKSISFQVNCIDETDQLL